jgi:predicted molibdopterin-dependent oxidoreductase YjgC
VTSSTGRVQLARRGLFPRGQAKPAWEILALAARQLELTVATPLAPRTFFEEMAAEVPPFAGMTWRRLTTEPGIPVLEEVGHVG